MDNIYIKALEIGVKNINYGITFEKIKEELYVERKSLMFKTSFRFWFYENFFHPEIPTSIHNQINGIPKDYPSHIDHQSSILTGKAYMDYLDYVALQEARQSAKFAKKIAFCSIGLTLTAIIVQILLNIFL